MRVTLLGPVGVESAGAVVALGGPKQRAVFALLALDVGRVVSLDRLILELWRDEPPAQATMALQSYVSRLRRVLAGVASPGAGSSIVTKPPGWMLDLPPENVDAVEFGALVNDGRDLLASGQPADAADRLRTALALWTGPAMGDLGLDGFAVADRMRLEQLRMDATESLFEAELAAGEPVAVVEEAERFTRENPFRERGWLALMVGLYRTGRQAEALAAAARLRVLLAEELGLDPSPEVSELENRILQHDPLLDRAPRADPWFGTAAGSRPLHRAEDGRGIPSPATTPPRFDQLDQPTELIVGRDDVLAIIDEVLAQAVRGRGRAVLIEGPAGIGKSTVLRAMTDRVELGGGTPLRGAGVGGGADAPAFWPWVQILRELNHEFPELIDLAGNPTLALLDPGLFEASPAPASEGHDAGLRRTRLYRAVIDLLTSARQQRPVVVVIDDAHWLDDASAHLLRVAVPELIEQGVVFVVGFRSRDSLVTHDALAILGELRRDLVVHLELAGLDLAGVEEVVRRMNGSAPHPGVSSAISTRTAGNPLFVGELVRLLISENRLDPQGVYEVLPTEVRDVLRRRLERLPEAAVDVLVVAALTGRPVNVPLLVGVTGMTEEGVLLACESATLTGLLLDNGERPGSFVLSHDLVRQTLVESVSAARRVRLHARIGEALQLDAALAPEHVVEVAHHLYLAAPLIGPAAAIPFMFTAADDALARMAMEQAESILDDTLTLAAGLGRQERSAVEHQARGRLAVIRVFRQGPVVAGASGLLDTPASQSRLTLDPADPTEWWAAMMVAVALGEYEHMVIEAKAAQRLDLPDVVGAMVHLELGLALFELGQFDGAGVELRAARALLGDRDASDSVALSLSGDAVLNLLGMMAHFSGDEAEADALLAEATSKSAGAPTRMIVTAFGRSWLAASRGDASTCAVEAEECARLGVELEYPAYIGMGQILSGWAAAMRGDPSGVKAADAAYATYVSDGTRLHTTLFSMLRAEAHARHGGPDRARQLVWEARQVTAETGERSLGPRLLALADELAGAANTP